MLMGADGVTEIKRKLNITLCEFVKNSQKIFRRENSDNFKCEKHRQTISCACVHLLYFSLMFKNNFF